MFLRVLRRRVERALAAVPALSTISVIGPKKPVVHILTATRHPICAVGASRRAYPATPSNVRLDDVTARPQDEEAAHRTHDAFGRSADLSFCAGNGGYDPRVVILE